MNNNNMLYWLAGGAMVVLVLVAFSAWTPDRAGPQDIMPAAGSPAYVDPSPRGSYIPPERTTNSVAPDGTQIIAPTGTHAPSRTTAE